MATKDRLSSFGNRMNNFANKAAESKTDNTLRKINADEIVENKYNSSIFSMDGIESLSESMKESGDLEPIRVWKRADGKYEIIAGHRRFRAHQLNGDKYIDAIIAEGKSESQVISELILTNVLARRLTPIEDARAMKLYIEKVLPELRESGEASGKSKEILSKLWGISPSSVSRRLSLLKLTNDLQSLLETTDIDFMAFIPLTQCSTDVQEKAYEKIKEILDKEPETKTETEEDPEAEPIASAITASVVKKIIEKINSENDSAKEPSIRVKSSITKVEKSLSSLFQSLEKEGLPESDTNIKITKKNIDNVKQLKEQLERMIEQFEANET